MRTEEIVSKERRDSVTPWRRELRTEGKKKAA